MRRVGTALELADLVRDRGPAVVLTGAGMSTESGIPDFRSAAGVWAEVDPFEVASIDAFRRDPLRVWRWYGPRIGGLLEAQPNAGHVALAALERRGHVQAVLTQNIDLLHSRAGSEDVVELHGSIRDFRCLACGGIETLDDVLAQLEVREAPVCGACGTVVKPGVVMFGELLPVAAVERAEELCREAGLLLVVGSSLQVWPVAGLPGDTLRAGGVLAIVNLEETPYDADALAVVRAPSGTTLAEVARALAA
jgi:NAD-dependent deacetylase